MINNISVVIITKDAANTIKDTLESVRDFAEVVIYDNGSSDSTMDIASGYSNVKLIQGEFNGFGLTKRAASNQANNDWILSLDADEQATPDLIQELTLWSEKADIHDVGSVLRENLLYRKKVTHSGWGNDWLIRIFNRQINNFNDAIVHECVDVSTQSQIKKFKNGITHYAVDDLSEFLIKIDRYSELRAQTLKKHHPIIIVIKTLFAFLKTYFIQLGILDGRAGLIIAISNANGTFWKYMKCHYRSSEPIKKK